MKVSARESSRPRRAWIATLAIMAGVALATERTAQAQDNTVLAETLFQDAKKLMARGDYATACPKLAESYRLDPGNGTRLALAICYEREGKTATAWALFGDVAAAARQEKRVDRGSIARDHIAALGPALSRLVIDVPSNAAGLEIKRDGITTPEAAWGTAVPVDPGDHVVIASAPGKKSWQVTVNVRPKADRVTVSIPALEDDVVVAEPIARAPVPPPKPQEPPREAEGNGRRTIGFVVGGAGLAALGVGAFFGVRAITKSDEAKSLCPGVCTNVDAVNTNAEAKTSARVANITIGAGLVALVVGGVLVLSSPSRARPKSALLLPVVDRRAGGIAFQTTW